MQRAVTKFSLESRMISSKSRMPMMVKSLGQLPSNFSTTTESYTEKQAKLGRPVSPHVTIYRSTDFHSQFTAPSVTRNLQL